MPILPPYERPECSVSTCENPAEADGLCNGHYKRQKTFGDPRADIPLRKIRRGRTEKCSRDGCEETYCASGLCSKHYMEERKQRLEEDPCVVAECDRPRGTSTGYCVRHYQRLLKYGDPLAGGAPRVLRGTGKGSWYYSAQRRAAKATMSQVCGETAEYVKIIRKDPCVYCGSLCEHIDHIVPFADGGPTDWSNLAPTCSSCNLRKNRKSVLEFMLRAT